MQDEVMVDKLMSLTKDQEHETDNGKGKELEGVQDEQWQTVITKSRSKRVSADNSGASNRGKSQKGVTILCIEKFKTKEFLGANKATEAFLR
ncbi:hypothetical protein RIF29_24860 [Crotalaria pallida]|uniref:Uncharacterized protein n=1 Tax=Crotalaria pallida TaxID=3830 RepID=A0AAN9EL80_CROPI